MKTQEELHKEALAEGYKDEKCPTCGTMFLAHHHFVICDQSSCPMKSTIDTKSVLEHVLGTPDKK